MKITINEIEFTNEFEKMNRGNNFSMEGKKALFEYIEQYEEETGEEIELDIIALCCEYTEYKTAIECAKNYNKFALSAPSNELSEEEAEKEAIDFLRDRTVVIEFEGGVIVGEF